MIPVILAGGTGSRIWPISRPKRPKQFLPLSSGSGSLLQATAHRALALSGCAPESVLTVTTPDLEPIARQHLSAVHPDLCNGLIIEPMRKGTGAAIALAVAQANLGDLLWIMPADHDIVDIHPLHCALSIAKHVARIGYLAILGLYPSWPNAHMGYIQYAKPLPGETGAFSVVRFVEKPHVRDAKKYAIQKDYLWNAGMIVGLAGAIRQEIVLHAPEYWNPVDYAALIPQAFDRLVLEKTQRAAVVPCALSCWRDMGSWRSLAALLIEKVCLQKHPPSVA